MKELRFEYVMRLDFSPMVSKHRFTLKCIPHSDERQKVSELEVVAYPREFISEAEDAFGNHCIYGHAEGMHDHFSFRVTGKAATGLAPWEHAKEDHLIGIYRYQTEYTRPGPCIRKFADSFSFTPEMTAYDKAFTFMTGLYRSFQYVPYVTGIHTTAEEAMALGKGVCQDYSHILLSLCRMEGSPCRYVVGMLIGEGASHAWVEICSEGRWIALDPTNNLVVDDQHIKISAGRDYQDCIINQGIFTGQTRQTQQILVSVKETENQRSAPKTRSWRESSFRR